MYFEISSKKFHKSLIFKNNYFENLEKNRFSKTLYAGFYNNKNKLISASLFLLTNKILQYHLNVTSSEFYRKSPSKAILSNMRKKFNHTNIDFFNLGGGLKNDIDDGLFKFKQKFNGDIYDYFLLNIIHLKDEYSNEIKKNFVKIQNESNINFFPTYRFINST